MRRLYFAYGSNMQIATLRRRAPSARPVGRGYVAEHALRFSRRSIRTGTGVADIVPRPGLRVWGALFEVDDDQFEQLELKEGVKISAYRTIRLEVRSGASVEREANTFVVVNKEEQEVPPSMEYLTSMIDGARENDLPKSYLSFLSSLVAEAGRTDFRQSLLAAPTADRTGAGGISIARINHANAGEVRSNGLAVAGSNGKVVICRVIYGNDVPLGQCQLDQSLRHMLGMPGRYCYGNAVQLYPAERRRWGGLIVKPRTLQLAVHQPNWQDAEKNICVLSPRNISLLGLSEGEYVTVVAPSIINGRGTFRSVTLRVFGGTEPQETVDQAGPARSYPDINEVYIDSSVRKSLHLPAGLSGLTHPVLVLPSIRKLFFGRILYYGLTLFLGVATSASALSALVPNLSTDWRGLIAISFALAVTFGLAIVDLRSRLRY